MNIKNNPDIKLLLAYIPPVIFSILIAICFTSCEATKNSYYFQNLKKDTTITGLVDKNLESRINTGDNLSILIGSLSKEEDVFFNTIPVSGTSQLAGYLVDDQGFISMHKLGKVKAAGLTRKELSAELQKQLMPFLKDPLVTIQYLNHKITVMGEVVRPQVIQMPEEQLSLIDVIVMSGDLTPDGKRSDVLVIREKGNEKKIKHLNLEDHSIFTSPWYYVQPNDIVMVSPDFEKRNKEAKRTRLQTNISILVSTVSVLIIILDRITRR